MDFYQLKDFSKKFNIPLGRLKLQCYQVRWIKEKVFKKCLCGRGAPKLGIFKDDIPRYFELAEKFAENEFDKDKIKNGGVYKEYSQWTKASVVCFLNRLDCAGCPNWDIACKRIAELSPFGKPPLKTVTLQLFRDIGKPPTDLIRETEEIA